MSVVISAQDNPGVACDRRGCGRRWWLRTTTPIVGDWSGDELVRRLAEVRGWRCSTRADYCPEHGGRVRLVATGCSA